MTRPAYHYLVFDCETTGLDPKTDRVVEMAAQLWRHTPRSGKNTLVGEWHSLVHPERPIPASATAIHGIRDEDVANAFTFREACLLFGEWLASHAEAGRFRAEMRGSAFVTLPIVAHHAAFDERFCTVETESMLPRTVRLLWTCSKYLAHSLLPAAPSYRLHALTREYGIADIACREHRALDDVRAAAALLHYLMSEHPGWSLLELRTRTHPPCGIVPYVFAAGG